MSATEVAFDPTEMARRRILLGWSRAELSRRTSINASTIGQIESGRLVPYASQLAKIEAAFGAAGE